MVDKNTPSDANIILELWRGNLPLGIAFWVFFVFCNMVIVSLFSFYLNGLDPSMVEQSEKHALLPALVFVVGIPLMVIFMVITIVGTWKSSNKYEGNQLLPLAAKIVILADMIAVLGYIL